MARLLTVSNNSVRDYGRTIGEGKMELEIKKTVNVDVKTLKLHLKVCDQCYFGIDDARGDEVLDCEGYVPDFFPGQHHGDYVQFDIDLETGKIINWEAPTAEDIQTLINAES